ncbi:hypothetical protein [Amycolatopsis sp.]|uniref:hypothetical protein n=1 Tax=Amycolatopsis sp. TaxID=37632 RepID=UPI0026279726|nr:hypothetical protein [Amycolatopsis sp.]
MILLGSRDHNDAAVQDLVELHNAVVAARSRARRGSLAAALLSDADLWVSIWLREWDKRADAGVHTHHIFALYQQMARHLVRVAERLSTVACRESPRIDSAACQTVAEIHARVVREQVEEHAAAEQAKVEREMRRAAAHPTEVIPAVQVAAVDSPRPPRPTLYPRPSPTPRVHGYIIPDGLIIPPQRRATSKNRIHAHV